MALVEPGTRPLRVSWKSRRLGTHRARPMRGGRATHATKLAQSHASFLGAHWLCSQWTQSGGSLPYGFPGWWPLVSQWQCYWVAAWKENDFAHPGRIAQVRLLGCASAQHLSTFGGIGWNHHQWPVESSTCWAKNATGMKCYNWIQLYSEYIYIWIILWYFMIDITLVWYLLNESFWAWKLGNVGVKDSVLSYWRPTFGASTLEPQHLAVPFLFLSYRVQWNRILLLTFVDQNSSI